MPTYINDTTKDIFINGQIVKPNDTIVSSTNLQLTQTSPLPEVADIVLISDTYSDTIVHLENYYGDYYISASGDGTLTLQDDTKAIQLQANYTYNQLLDFANCNKFKITGSIYLLVERRVVRC